MPCRWLLLIASLHLRPSSLQNPATTVLGFYPLSSRGSVCWLVRLTSGLPSRTESWIYGVNNSEALQRVASILKIFLPLYFLSLHPAISSLSLQLAIPFSSLHLPFYSYYSFVPYSALPYGRCLAWLLVILLTKPNYTEKTTLMLSLIRI